MTDAAASKPNLGRFGSFGRGVTPQQAKEIESLGYGAAWVGGSPPAELAWVEPILEATTTLQVATGIVNIWTAPARAVAESFHRIDKAYPGRFLLGIGVGHREVISEYRKPYDALVEYLDRLDDFGVPEAVGVPCTATAARSGLLQVEGVHQTVGRDVAPGVPLVEAFTVVAHPPLRRSPVIGSGVSCRGRSWWCS